MKFPREGKVALPSSLLNVPGSLLVTGLLSCSSLSIGHSSSPKRVTCQQSYCFCFRKQEAQMPTGMPEHQDLTAPIYKDGLLNRNIASPGSSLL